MELRDIKNYEGLYQADKKGDIYSTKRATTKGGKLKKSLRHGYYCVCLCKGAKKNVYRVNRLIALTFIPNNMNKSQVNHLDGNKLNDKVENLEWVTAKENNQHAIDNGLKFNKPTIFSDADCIDFFIRKERIDKKSISMLHGVNLSTLYRAIKRGEELTIKENETKS